jgi:hypothetical protein
MQLLVAKSSAFPVLKCSFGDNKENNVSHNFFLFFKSFIDQGDTFNHSQTISHFNGKKITMQIPILTRLASKSI